MASLYTAEGLPGLRRNQAIFLNQRDQGRRVAARSTRFHALGCSSPVVKMRHAWLSC
jgi:hypothetical protein